MRRSFYMVLLLSILSACNQNQAEPGEPKGNFLQLSTNQQSEEAQPLEDIEGIEQIPETQVPQDTPEVTEQPNPANDETDTNQAKEQPSPAKDEINTNQAKEQEFTQQGGTSPAGVEAPIHTAYNFNLPFTDFKQRWNAISNQQGSNLTISSFEKVEGEDGLTYRASLPSKIELRLVVAENKITHMTMIGQGQSQGDRFNMLTGWSQMYMLLNPQAQPHDVDTFFAELGVGPNADLSHVEGKSLDIEGVRYTVTPLPAGYQFGVSDS